MLAVVQGALVNFARLYSSFGDVTGINIQSPDVESLRCRRMLPFGSSMLD